MENAVNTQIRIAIAVYALVSILKKRLKSEASLYTILQILSLNLFEKTPINQLVAKEQPDPQEPEMDNQLNIFTEISGQ